MFLKENCVTFQHYYAFERLYDNWNRTRIPSRYTSFLRGTLLYYMSLLYTNTSLLFLLPPFPFPFQFLPRFSTSPTLHLDSCWLVSPKGKWEKQYSLAITCPCRIRDSYLFDLTVSPTSFLFVPNLCHALMLHRIIDSSPYTLPA